MKTNNEFLKSIIVGTLLFSMIGCAQAKETGSTNAVKESAIEEEVHELNFEDVYETLQTTFPSLSIVKNVKTDTYNWFKHRNKVTVDGITFYIDEYENYDDAKMYTEAVKEYNALDQYTTNTLGVTSDYLTQVGIDLESYKIDDYQFDKFIFVYPNTISEKTVKQIESSMKTLDTNNESEYSNKEYSKLYKQRKEKWDTEAYKSLITVFEEKDAENQKYVDEVTTKYQDTTVSEDNYLTLETEVEKELNAIKVVSSTTRYTEMYAPVNNRLNEIEKQCTEIVTNHSNDLDSKISSLENEMNYDLLAEICTLYASYKTQDAYADKVNDWNTKITSLNKVAEQKKAEEEAAAKKAEEERLATEEEKQTQAAAQQEHTYVINTNTGVFHNQNCRAIKRMKDKNKWVYTGTRQSVIDMNYKSCQICNP